MTVKQAISRANDKYKINTKLASECVCMEPKTALNRELEDAEYAYHEERMKFVQDLRQLINNLNELTNKINKLESMLKGE